MEIRPEPIEEIDKADTLFQSALWGDFKHDRGHKVRAFSIHKDGSLSGAEGDFDLLVIFRGFTDDTSFGYIPYGPNTRVPQSNQGLFLEELAERLRSRLPADCSHLRFDLPWESPFMDDDFFDERHRWLGPPEDRLREMRMNFGTSRWNLKKAPTDMQPADTVVLDLTKSAEILLKEMKPKTRYNIGVARRRGVEITITDGSGLSSWYPLYKRTARRKGIIRESLSYFKNLIDVSERLKNSPGPGGHKNKEEIKVFLARHNDDLLGGIIAARFEGKAYYLYGASGDVKQNYMASYALQWEAIQWAKRKGAVSYDFFGIPPNSDPSHPMHGLYRFKTGFGGLIRHFRGCWDYPYNRELYDAAALSRGIRGGYHT